MKRAKLQEQARIREERLRGTSGSHINQDDFKEKLEIPAYQRKQVRLAENQPSSERNISALISTMTMRLWGTISFYTTM